MQGYKTSRIVIGTEAKRMKEPIADITHEWKAYVIADPELVKTVQFKLHESFTNHIINVEYPFEIFEMGWGEFTIQVKIILHNEDRLFTSHFLKLHGEEDIIINETHDEICHKGLPSEVSSTPEEDEELKKIDNAIAHMLSLFKEEVEM